METQKGRKQPSPVYRSFLTHLEIPPPYPYSLPRKVRLYLGRWVWPPYRIAGRTSQRHRPLALTSQIRHTFT